MSISIVLPLRIDADRPTSDLDRFIAIGLPSLHRFVQASFVKELIVVSPTKDVRRIEQRLAASARFSCRVLDENKLCPEMASESGWYKQQILKLAVAGEISTPWYLTLDADIICVRQINETFLFPDGRAIWQKEPASHHMKWWDGSRSFLQLTMPIQDDQPMIGVTPALMHTPSVHGLIRRIESLYPDAAWSSALMESFRLRWSEYTLYWLHLLDLNLTGTLYSDSDNILYARSGSVWTPDHLKRHGDTWLDDIFHPDSCHGFIVFQSTVDVPLPALFRSFRARIDGISTPAAADRARWLLHRARFHWRRVTALPRRAFTRLIGYFGPGAKPA